ncbi:MAG TPA: DUF1648 domain-containing protein [Egibacteraceae bacterium]
MNRRPGLIGSAIALAVMLAASAWAWPQLPADARVPVHWGLDGTPDRYGGKVLGLLGLPAIAIGVALLLAVVPAVEPRAGNLARSQRAYSVTWVATMAFLAVVHLAAVASAVGVDVPVTSAAVVAAGALLAVVGVALRRTRSTYTFGIRTPWTLDSDRAWARTHAVGSVLFVALGVATAVAGLLSAPRVQVAVLLGGLAAVLLALLAVSYVTWRTDPDRRSDGGV